MTTIRPENKQKETYDKLVAELIEDYENGFRFTNYGLGLNKEQARKKAGPWAISRSKLSFTQATLALKNYLLNKGEQY